jgi:phosphoglycerate kinase
VKGLKDFDVKDMRVLVRCDFNVPLNEKGDILDDFRIKQTIPTIEYLRESKAKIILMSHLGKPKGEFIKSLKLDRIQEKLSDYLNSPVLKAEDCVGEEVEKLTRDMRPGEVLILENLRFHKEEEEGNLEFAKSLARLGDIFINEAFAACHRSHASIVGIPKYLPSGIGFLLEKEIENLKKIIEKPELPLVAIFGGKEGDFKAINRISEITSSVLIGYLIKKQIEETKIALRYPEKIISPIDGIEENNNLDIGPKTLKIFNNEILKAKTIFWSGPIGKVEEDKYQRGTKEIANSIIKSGAFSVVGGGETVEFLNEAGIIDKFSHVSTGGNAMFSFLAGEELPGITALK